MEEVVFSLKTVTPLMLHGADPSGMAEIRPPSIRGLMRYWFRAALGGVIGDKNINDLHKKESELFGSTTNGGAICTRIVNIKNCTTGKQAILPHHDNSAKREAFTSANFDIILSSTHPISKELWQAGVNSLLLAITLGGLGQRSRRGYGALAIQKISDQNIKFLQPSSYNDIETQLQEMIKKIMADFNLFVQGKDITITGLSDDIPLFPCASEKAKIWIGPEEMIPPLELITNFMGNIQQIPELGGVNHRHASPLWVKPIETKNHGSMLLMTYLPSESCCKGQHPIKNVEDALLRYHGKSLSIQGWNV